MKHGARMGLGLDRPGASPLIHLSLMSFLLSDPGFYAVRATVLEFRVSASRDLVAPVLEAAPAAVGPVGVLLERVAQVSWTWDCARQVFQDPLGDSCIWHVWPQELDFHLALGWQSAVAAKVHAVRLVRLSIGCRDVLSSMRFSAHLSWCRYAD